MNKATRPLLAVTMGDPAGVGPEVIVGAWAAAAVHESVRPVVVGHPEIMRRAAGLLGRDIQVDEIESSSTRATAADPNTMPCIPVCCDDALAAPTGCAGARSGEAAYQAVRMAAQLALGGAVDGIVTAPISKAALHAAGHYYPGHTELLAEICGVRDFAMMLYLSREQGARSKKLPPAPGFGVVHVTLHQSLRSVFDEITPANIITKCRLVDGAMRSLGAPRPRLAVCALNPHAGEDGLFGDEERTIIAPAVEAARQAGLDVSGPFPADTLMARAAAGEFDAIVAMYHDQGHIAVKLLGMHEAVNITLGLPIVRTSVAHGTAFDRAWQGTAKCNGMIAALLTAGRLCNASDQRGAH
jgi:4-hydroxythreonine-4-phosphate dehydrogenase